MNKKVFAFLFFMVGTAHASVMQLERTESGPYEYGAYFQIRGTATWVGHGSYQLYVSSTTNPYMWTQFYRNHVHVENGILAAPMPVELLRRGTNAILLRGGTTGRQVEDIWEFQFESLGKITSPQSNDVLARDPIIPIFGTLTEEVEYYEIEWGVGIGTDSWSTDGIVLSQPDKFAEQKNVLARWNTALLPPDEEFFRLRLTVETEITTFITHVHFIRLDPQLRAGWPLRDERTNIHIRSADIDKDGEKEVWVFGNEPDDTFSISKLTNNRNLGRSRRYDMKMVGKPVIGNFDTDPYDEMIVAFTNAQNTHRTVVFQHDGHPKVEFDITGLNLTLADLDRDGISELITLVDMENGFYQIFIFNHEKNILGIVPGVQMCTPAVGNFDNDLDLEFVCATAERGVVAIYEKDGRVLRNFFVDADYSSPYYPIVNKSVVGDVNGDGRDDIVLTVREAGRYSKLHVVDRYGHMLPGEWPREGHHGRDDMEGLYFPVLADFQNDGKLEIGVIGSPCYYGTGLYFFDAQGADLWDVFNDHHEDAHVRLEAYAHPSPNTSGFIIGDVTGDGNPNITLSHISLMTSQFKLDRHYGAGMHSEINVWNPSGELVDMNPTDRTELFVESQNRVAPIIDDIDGDGKIEMVVVSDNNQVVIPKADFSGALALFKKNRSSIYIYDFDTVYNAHTFQWPTHRGDNKMSGHYGGFNMPPFVDAGDLDLAYMESTTTLKGIVRDDGRHRLTPLVRWDQLSGPADVQFKDQASAETTVQFPAVGTYVFRFRAWDGEFIGSDELTIEVKNLDLIAELDRTPPHMTDSEFQIRGTAAGDSFGTYFLYVSHSVAPYNWIRLGSGNNAVVNDVLLDNLSIEKLKPGKNALRLYVRDANRGNYSEVEDIWEFEFKPVVEAIYPLNNDVIRKDSHIKIKGAIHSPYTQYKVEWGVGVSTEVWSSQGMELVQPQAGDPFSGILAVWNTAFMPMNEEFVNFRITAEATDGEYNRVIRLVRLDSQLKHGWPVYSPLQDIQLRISDLDKNGRKEIILMGNNTENEFSMETINQNSWQKWSTSYPLMLIGPPVVGNFDQDLQDEIIVPLGIDKKTPSKIMVFNHNGAFARDYHIAGEKLALADMTRNGVSELVVNVKDDGVFIFNNEFDVLGHVEDIACNPSFGNFDEDRDLELVCGTPRKEEVAIYNFDGSMVKKWTINAFVTNFSDSVVGDVDNDGDDEIVVINSESLFPDGGGDSFHAKIRIYDHNGHLLPGSWPVEGHHGGPENEYLSFPVLADFDDNNDLEIGFIGSPCYVGTGIYFYDHDGEYFPGWDAHEHVDLEGPGVHPISNPSGFIVGDLTGNRRSDVLITHRENTWTFAVAFGVNIFTEIMAWDANVNEVDLNPTDHHKIFVEATGQIESLIDDIDGDGKVELIAVTGNNREFFESHFRYGSPTQISKNRSSIYIWDLKVPFDEKANQWVTRRGDNQRSGHYGGFNTAPIVQAHPLQNASVNGRNIVSGDVMDDGKTKEGVLTKWQVIEGPGKVDFEDPLKLTTRVYFEKPGPYVLRLFAWDGEFSASDLVKVNVKDIVRQRIRPRRRRNFVRGGQRPEIGFDLTETRHVTVDIFDRRGRLIKRLVNHSFGPGPHTIEWDRKDGSGLEVTSGIYTVLCNTGDQVQKTNLIISK